MAAMLLRVGCPMWAHQPWQGRFLPEGLGRGEQLAAYATWCTAVEGNTTFYGEPSADTVRAWADETPPDFRFVFKLPRTITHERRLRRAEREVASFVSRVAPLGDRAETLSIQLPGSFGPGDLSVLAAFLTGLPDTHRWAVEVRHPRFFDGSAPGRALQRLLADHGAEWIEFDTTAFFAGGPPASEAEREAWGNKPRLPRRTEALGDRPVVRYLGRDDVGVTEAGWQPWLPVVARWLEEGRTPTFFVHTPDNVEALGLARRFHDQVRARCPALDALPEPVQGPPTLF
jgi:uncharacterized protein YecE (DUF72 family)